MLPPLLSQAASAASSQTTTPRKMRVLLSFTALIDASSMQGV